jgi:uncharacterized protein
VTLICDASGLLVLPELEDPARDAVLATLSEEEGQLILPQPVATEVAYLLGARFGAPQRRAFLRDLAEGRYLLASLQQSDLPSVMALDVRYADLDLGLADCSIVVLAERVGTRRLLSFDERHFRAVAPLQGGTFELLPADLG